MDNRYPSFWDILSDVEKDEYICIQKALSTPTSRTTRKNMIGIFQKALELLKAYVNKGDDKDWCRSLVTGILWLSHDALALNTSQLHVLFRKCKSSINGGFQDLGFVTLPPSTDGNIFITNKFPILKDYKGEVRKWSLHVTPTNKRIESKLPPLQSLFHENKTTVQLLSPLTLNEIDNKNIVSAAIKNDFPVGNEKNTLIDDDLCILNSPIIINNIHDSEYDSTFPDGNEETLGPDFYEDYIDWWI